MKFKACIFVEGEADVRFVDCFVKHRFGYELKKGIELLRTHGKDALHEVKVKFIEIPKQEIRNLIIFDADEAFANSKAKLNNKRETLSIVFDSFLFPDDENGGDLETLLEQIVNPSYKQILACFDQFKDCLTNMGEQQVRLPNRKDKIYMYASLLSTNEKAKELKRDYLDGSLWNLNSDFLTPLYNFLKPHFEE